MKKRVLASVIALAACSSSCSSSSGGQTSLNEQEAIKQMMTAWCHQLQVCALLNTSIDACVQVQTNMASTGPSSCDQAKVDQCVSDIDAATCQTIIGGNHNIPVPTIQSCNGC